MECNLQRLGKPPVLTLNSPLEYHYFSTQQISITAAFSDITFYNDTSNFGIPSQ